MSQLALKKIYEISKKTKKKPEGLDVQTPEEYYGDKDVEECLARDQGKEWHGYFAKEKDGYRIVNWNDFNHEYRSDPVLVKVVKSLKKRASGQFAQLEVVKIPDDVVWEIESYDGIEWVREKSRVWG